MNIPALPSGLYREDYDRIEAAVMETVRGRWFLLEYARRQRAVETERLVQAVDRLERFVAARETTVDAPSEQTPEPEAAADPADLRRMRRIAEKARDFARALRERGLDEELCSEAEELAYAVAELAGQADVAAEEPIVSEARVLIAPRMDDLQTLDIEASSADLDDIEAEAIEAEEAETREAASEVEVTSREIEIVDARLAALSRLDHLSLDEKLLLFG